MQFTFLKEEELYSNPDEWPNEWWARYYKNYEKSFVGTLFEPDCGCCGDEVEYAYRMFRDGKIKRQDLNDLAKVHFYFSDTYSEHALKLLRDVIIRNEESDGYFTITEGDIKYYLFGKNQNDSEYTEDERSYLTYLVMSHLAVLDVTEHGSGVRYMWLRKEQRRANSIFLQSFSWSDNYPSKKPAYPKNIEKIDEYVKARFEPTFSGFFGCIENERYVDLHSFLLSKS